MKFDLLLEDPRRHTVVAGIGADVVEADRLLQNAVEHPVDVLDGLGGQRLLAVALFAEGVVQVLDHAPVQLIQADMAEGGPDVQRHGALVVVRGGVLQADGVIRQPDIDPLVERHGAGVDVGFLVDLVGNLADFLPDFLLRLSVDRMLNLLAGDRIKAVGEAAFPAPVGTLADRAAAVGRAGVFVVWQ